MDPVDILLGHDTPISKALKRHGSSVTVVNEVVVVPGQDELRADLMDAATEHRLASCGVGDAVLVRRARDHTNAETGEMSTGTGSTSWIAPMCSRQVSYAGWRTSGRWTVANDTISLLTHSRPLVRA